LNANGLPNFRDQLGIPNCEDCRNSIEGGGAMGVGENLTQIPKPYLDVDRTLIQKDSLRLSANCVLLIVWQKSFKDSCFKKNES
jgi:hypothetical protein